MRSRARALVAVVVIALAAAGCSSKKSVGQNLSTGFNNSGSGRLGDRASTTTTAAPTSTTAKPVTTTTVKPATTTTAKPAQAQPVALEISIRPDTATSQFDPSQGRIFTGTCARFTNRDTQARSAEADDGAFNTGSIAPGASANVCLPAAGKHGYHDGTRPYAVGSLEAVAR